MPLSSLLVHKIETYRFYCWGTSKFHEDCPNHSLYKIALKKMFTVALPSFASGQHNDEKMFDSFFEQLDIPKPDFSLEVGPGTQAKQTAQIMVGYEEILLSAPPDFCLVVGDVTSTMACAITAQKLRVPVAHVEADIQIMGLVYAGGNQ